MLKIFKIQGDSLFPLFKDKDLVLCLKTKNPKVKDTVVFYQKQHGIMIKQVQNIKNNQCFLIGTNPDSIDSRDFGYIDAKDIKYKVLFKLF